jgi:hypothetical protein
VGVASKFSPSPTFMIKFKVWNVDPALVVDFVSLYL